MARPSIEQAELNISPVPCKDVDLAAWHASAQELLKLLEKNLEIIEEEKEIINQ